MILRRAAGFSQSGAALSSTIADISRNPAKLDSSFAGAESPF
ncbi:hypothetical protein [Aquamicrobium sp. LC103]|nr:hypothetical protein [Aquamicrobium sp. LC103]